MGTSVAHRSPRGWGRLRREFRRSPIDPARVVSAAAHCLNEKWGDRFSAASVAQCLDAWMSRVYRRHPRRGWTAIDLCQVVQADLRLHAAQSHDPGLATDLALRAAHGACVELADGDAGVFDAARPAREVVEAARARGQEALVALFIGHYLAALFGYLVSRDSSDFVGQAGLPDLAARERLLAAVQGLCAAAVAPKDVRQVAEVLAAVRKARGERVYAMSLALAALWPVLLRRLRRA